MIFVIIKYAAFMLLLPEKNVFYTVEQQRGETTSQTQLLIAFSVV